MAVVGVTALSMAACNRGTESAGGGSDSVTIGLAVANLQADFFNQIKQSVDAEAKKAGATVRVSDAGGDAATQVNQIQDFITRQVDVIIYIPAGATAAGVPVKAAKRAGIPVVAVDRNAPDAPGDTFIATDSVAAAKTLGDWVAKTAGGKGSLPFCRARSVRRRRSTARRASL